VDLIEAYGNRLLELQPDATTALLVQLTTTSATTSSSSTVVPLLNLPINRMMSVFTGHEGHLLLYLEEVHGWLRKGGGGGADAGRGSVGSNYKVQETLLELYLEEHSRLKDRVAELSTDSSGTSIMSRPSNSSSGSSVRGSDRGSGDGSGNGSDSLLGSSSSSSPSIDQLRAAVEHTEEKIMNILDSITNTSSTSTSSTTSSSSSVTFDGEEASPDRSDPNRALMLTASFGFRRGTLFLLEKSDSNSTGSGSASGRNAPLLLKLLTSSDDKEGVLRLLKREGGRDPDLYSQALSYFVKTATAIATATATSIDEKRDSEGEEDDRWVNEITLT
jgi:hypothetical protein